MTRKRTRIARLSIAAILALSTVLGTLATSSATPSKQEVADAKAHLSELNRTLDGLIEQYNQARLKLEQARTARDAALKDMRAAQAVETQARADLSARAGGRAAGAAAAAAANGGTGGSGGSGGFVPPPNASQAQIAIAAAESAIGTPYVWGAASPGVGFDCSGLVMWSYAQAGVSLPHSSAAQYAMLPHLSRDQLEPGDLLFFYTPVSHVAIYLGGDQEIDASHPGTTVSQHAVYWDGFVGGGRPT